MRLSERIKRFFSKILRRPSDDPGRGGVRKDVVRYPIQDNAFLDVFWKSLLYGRGPSMSLVVHDVEVVKFDCFGEGAGHFHLHASAERHHFEEKSVEAQIDRTLLELRQNIRQHLQSSAYPKIREFPLDSDKWNQALAPIKDKMLEYAVRASRVLPPARL